MRRLNIKLITIFIIFIFCLSPLAAIDFNQDQKATIVNDENKSIFTADDTIGEPVKDCEC